MTKDFIVQAYLLKQKTEGVKHHLVGLCDGRIKASHVTGYDITDCKRHKIGEVPSGNYGPVCKNSGWDGNVCRIIQRRINDLRESPGKKY